MTLQLEVGKYYKNRKGEKIGPLVENQPGTSFRFTLAGVDQNNENHKSWLPNGSVWSVETSKYDLIEEWNDEEKPIATGDLSNVQWAEGGQYTATGDLSFEQCMKFGSSIANGVSGSNDPVNNPKHYTSHPSGIECIDITKHMSFTLGNALKYIWRADLKNGVEDLEKAIWYLQTEVDKRKSEG